MSANPPTQPQKESPSNSREVQGAAKEKSDKRLDYNPGILTSEFQWVTFASITKTAPTVHLGTIRDFIEQVFDQGNTRTNKRDCELFQCVGLKPEATRGASGIVFHSALVADYDEAEVAMSVAVEFMRAKGRVAIFYRSFTSPAGGTKWRMVIPTLRYLSSSEMKEALARVNRWMSEIRVVISAESFVPAQAYYYGFNKEAVNQPGLTEVVGSALLDTDAAQFKAIAPLYPIIVAAEVKAGRPLFPNEVEQEIQSAAARSGGKLGTGCNRTGLLFAYLKSYRQQNNVDLDSLGAEALRVADAYFLDHHTMRIQALVDWADEKIEYNPRTQDIAGAFLNDPEDPNRLARSDFELLGLEPEMPVAIRQAIQGENHDAIALNFREIYQGRLLFSTAHNRWFEYDGSRWKVDRTARAFHYVRELCREHQDPSKPKSTIASAGFAGGVETFCRADPDLNTDGSDWDADNYLLNTPDGTIDLRANLLREANPEDLITLITLVGPEQGEPTVFLRFLDEITLGDQEVQDFLQVSLGACLSGAVESHWMMFWVGSGRNGKNTLGDLVQEILGGYSKKIPSDVLMSKKQQGHPTEIANLQGTRLAVASEVDEGAFWDEARINEVTGDRELSARFMRQDLFTFKRTHKHLVYGNHRPQLRSISGGIRSRLKIVPFKASFVGREDFDLPAKLAKESGMVLAWLLEGHRKWLADGKRLPKCSAVDAETNDYFASQSTVDLWISERLRVVGDDGRSATGWHKASELFDDYTQWKVSRGEKALGQQRWGEKMKEKFQQVLSGGHRYIGVEKLPIDKWG